MPTIGVIVTAQLVPTSLVPMNLLRTHKRVILRRVQISVTVLLLPVGSSQHMGKIVLDNKDHKTVICVIGHVRAIVQTV